MALVLVAASFAWSLRAATAAALDALGTMHGQCHELVRRAENCSDVELAAFCRAKCPLDVCRAARFSLGDRPWLPERVGSFCQSWETDWRSRSLIDETWADQAVIRKTSTEPPSGSPLDSERSLLVPEPRYADLEGTLRDKPNFNSTDLGEELAPTPPAPAPLSEMPFVPSVAPGTQTAATATTKSVERVTSVAKGYADTAATATTTLVALQLAQVTGSIVLAVESDAAGFAQASNARTAVGRAVAELAGVSEDTVTITAAKVVSGTSAGRRHGGPAAKTSSSTSAPPVQASDGGNVDMAFSILVAGSEDAESVRDALAATAAVEETAEVDAQLRSIGGVPFVVKQVLSLDTNAALGSVPYSQTTATAMTTTRTTMPATTTKPMTTATTTAVTPTTFTKTTTEASSTATETTTTTPLEIWPATITETTSKESRRSPVLAETTTAMTNTTAITTSMVPGSSDGSARQNISNLPSMTPGKASGAVNTTSMEVMATLTTMATTMNTTIKASTMPRSSNGSTTHSNSNRTSRGASSGAYVTSTITKATTTIAATTTTMATTMTPTIKASTMPRSSNGSATHINSTLTSRGASSGAYVNSTITVANTTTAATTTTMATTTTTTINASTMPRSSNGSTTHSNSNLTSRGASSGAYVTSTITKATTTAAATTTTMARTTSNIELPSGAQNQTQRDKQVPTDQHVFNKQVRRTKRTITTLIKNPLAASTDGFPQQQKWRREQDSSSSSRWPPAFIVPVMTLALLATLVVGLVRLTRWGSREYGNRNLRAPRSYSRSIRFSPVPLLIPEEEEEQEAELGEQQLPLLNSEAASSSSSSWAGRRPARGLE